MSEKNEENLIIDDVNSTELGLHKKNIPWKYILIIGGISIVILVLIIIIITSLNKNEKGEIPRKKIIIISSITICIILAIIIVIIISIKNSSNEDSSITPDNPDKPFIGIISCIYNIDSD